MAMPFTTTYYPLQNPTILPLMSSRWNPTPEQVQALKEMYRQGITTPSAQQIHQITAKLRLFGNIQGKNVFYWFQNHKARDRQKQRRQCDNRHAHPGSSRRYLESRRLKKLHPMSNCTTSSKHKVCNEEKAPGQENANYPIVPLKILLPPKNNNFRNSESGNRENQTLQLFPVSNNDLVSTYEEEAIEGSRLVPNNFFEFFPTKS